MSACPGKARSMSPRVGGAGVVAAVSGLGKGSLARRGGVGVGGVMEGGDGGEGVEAVCVPIRHGIRGRHGGR